MAGQPTVRADPGLGIAPTGVDAPIPSPTDPRPDIPGRRTPPAVPPGNLPSFVDLDGTYVWLGPSGGAAYIDSSWDSVIGGDLSVVRVREHDALGTVGGSFGAAKWTERGGGRLWLEAIAGTRLVNRTMVGLSAGGIVELADTEHPRPGALFGVWAFVGVTPYVRVGAIQDDGLVVELGVHITLPVLRR
jgi:hypothetical protein